MLKSLNREVMSIEALDSSEDLNAQTYTINLDKHNMHNTGDRLT